MWVYIVAAIAGWAAALFIVIEILLAYLLRRTAPSRALGVARKTNSGYLQRLSPHYWLGYAVLALAFGHAMPVMGPSMARRPGRIGSLGLWAASVALLLLMLQAGFGLMLQNVSLPARRSIKRLHFVTMIALCGLIAIHVALN